MRIIWLSFIILSACVQIPAPEVSKSKQQKYQQSESERIASADFEAKNKEKDYSDWFAAQKEGLFQSQTLEKGFGCGNSFAGQGKDRVLLIPLVPIPTCRQIYQYRVKMTLYCQSPGDVQVPIKARGKKIYWSLRKQTGNWVSDLDGAVFATFLSDEGFDLKNELKLGLDSNFEQKIVTSEAIYLPKEACSKSK